MTKFPNSCLIPSGTGFNQLLASTIPEKATIEYLPVVDSSPTDLNTVLHRSVEIANRLDLPSIVVVVDQTIYSKAPTIRWQTPLFRDRLVIRLGVFHTTMTALACIGRSFRDVGLQDVLIEADVIAPGSVNGAMNLHHYNRSMRCHKLMGEALHRLRWQSFLDTLRDCTAQQYVKMITPIQNAFPMNLFSEATQDCVFQEMMKTYQECINNHSSNATYSYWSSYLDMVENVLLLTRATREGD